MLRRRSGLNRGRLPAIAFAVIVVAAACTSSATPASRSPSPTDPPRSSPTPTAPATPLAQTPTATTEPSAEPAPAAPAAWRQLQSTGPTPRAREDGTWTADPTSRTAYLFGGRDSSLILNDLWVYDLDADGWTRLPPEGRTPPKRFGHEAVWVDGLGVVVFAGQAGPTTFYDDLWAYDPTANRWRRLPGDGARQIARYGSCAALGPDGRLWISHGFTEDGTRFADTRAYDFAAGRWSDETPAGSAPVSRCLHGCWWTDDGRLALYAGQTTGVEALGDLWTLTGAGTASAAWARGSLAGTA